MRFDVNRLVLFALALGSGCVMLGQQPADLVILHGKIYTENPQQPQAEALAIRGGKIAAVGNEKQIEAYRGPNTQVIDAQQHMVLPGFTDTHVHCIGGSTAMQTVALDTADTVAEIQKRVKDFAVAHPDKKVITGYGWMYPVFGKAALPDKKILDAVVPDRPVVLSAYDHHTTWANSKALQMADINRATPNPLNGTIVRDPVTGEATGALKESAGNLVERLVPPLTHAEMLDALRQGLRQTTDGNPPGGWIPQERITLDQVIAGYTIGAAYAGKREKTEGSLEPGKLGDVIVISQNLYDVPPREVGKTEVLYTVVGGKIVYRSPAAKK